MRNGTCPQTLIIFLAASIRRRVCRIPIFVTDELDFKVGSLLPEVISGGRLGGTTPKPTQFSGKVTFSELLLGIVLRCIVFPQ
jgi:hypothetical protein